MAVKFVIVKGKGTNPIQMYYRLEIPMIQLEPGTILEKEYKGNKIKVKVLKDGSFSFNGKQYESRGDLMKAILKGKTGQFTNFFKDSLGTDEKPKKSKKVVEEQVEEIEEIKPNGSFNLKEFITSIVDERIEEYFRNSI